MDTSTKQSRVACIKLIYCFFLSRTTLGLGFSALPDKFNRKAILLILLIVMCISLLLAFFAHLSGHYILLIAACVLLGVVDRLFSPIFSASIPALVEKEHLEKSYRISFFTDRF